MGLIVFAFGLFWGGGTSGFLLPLILGAVWRVGFVESDLFVCRFYLSLLAGLSIMFLFPAAR